MLTYPTHMQIVASTIKYTSLKIYVIKVSSLAFNFKDCFLKQHIVAPYFYWYLKETKHETST